MFFLFGQQILLIFENSGSFYEFRINIGNRIKSKQFEQISMLQYKFAAVLMVVLLAGSVKGQSDYFQGLNLDPTLVANTNAAMKTLRTSLLSFNCQSSNPFYMLSFGWFDFNRYAINNNIKKVVENIKAIKTALKANNIVIGEGNSVQGVNNIVIGNHDIVKGNQLWIFTSNYTAASGSSELLVIENWEIDLNKASQFSLYPQNVVRCLSNTLKTLRFGLMGFFNYGYAQTYSPSSDSTTTTASTASPVPSNCFRLLI